MVLTKDRLIVKIRDHRYANDYLTYLLIAIAIWQPLLPIKTNYIRVVRVCVVLLHD